MCRKFNKTFSTYFDTHVCGEEGMEEVVVSLHTSSHFSVVASLLRKTHAYVPFDVSQ